MLLAITSDSHDNLVNIKRFIDFCNVKKVDLIIHCGDVTEKETERFFIDNLKAPIRFAHGNADIANQEKLKRTNRFQKIKHSPIPFLEFDIDGIKISACHTREKAKRLALSNKYNIVFYGHNHKPWEEKMYPSHATACIHAPLSGVHGCKDLFQRDDTPVRLVNPGNLAGMFYRASFATYDTRTRKLNLIILDQPK